MRHSVSQLFHGHGILQGTRGEGLGRVVRVWCGVVWSRRVNEGNDAHSTLHAQHTEGRGGVHMGQ